VTQQDPDIGTQVEPRPPKVTPMEVVIVGLVLAITAWVLVPQFSQAANNGRLHVLSSELHALRAQIACYRADHGGHYPGVEHFVAQMTGRTRADGSQCKPDDIGVSFGPYLHEIPINPFTGGNRVSGTQGDDATGEQADWRYDETTGQIHPCAETSPDAR